MMFCSNRNNVHLSKNSCKFEVFLKLNDVAVSDTLLLDPSLPFEWDSIYKRPRFIKGLSPALARTSLCWERTGVAHNIANLKQVLSVESIKPVSTPWRHCPYESCVPCFDHLAPQQEHVCWKDGQGEDEWPWCWAILKSETIEHDKASRSQKLWR